MCHRSGTRRHGFGGRSRECCRCGYAWVGKRNVFAGSSDHSRVGVGGRPWRTPRARPGIGRRAGTLRAPARRRGLGSSRPASRLVAAGRGVADFRPLTRYREPAGAGATASSSTRNRPKPRRPPGSLVALPQQNHNNKTIGFVQLTDKKSGLFRIGVYVLFLVGGKVGLCSKERWPLRNSSG